MGEQCPELPPSPSSPPPLLPSPSGLSPSCTQADVKKSYSKAALKFHPDKVREMMGPAIASFHPDKELPAMGTMEMAAVAAVELLVVVVVVVKVVVAVARVVVMKKENVEGEEEGGGGMHISLGRASHAWYAGIAEVVVPFSVRCLMLLCLPSPHISIAYCAHSNSSLHAFFSTHRFTHAGLPAPLSCQQRQRRQRQQQSRQ